jgi:cytidylate kinase
MIVTVSGMAGSGKGATSRLFAQTFNFRYIDFGLLFRFAAFCFNEQRLEPLMSMNQNGRLEVSPQFTRISLDGHDLAPYLRSEEAAALTSRYASDPASFAVMTSWAETYVLSFASGNLICDGRNCGTEIFSNAEVKFFLTCHFLTRASRRWRELREQKPQLSYAEVCQSMRDRDSLDKSRMYAPARQPVGAVVVNTARLSIEQVVSVMKSHVRF